MLDQRKDYYEANMTPPSPNMILINTNHLLEVRKRKHIKLVLLKEKSLAKQEPQEEMQSDNMILGQLNESDFSVFSSEKEENDQHDSYDSEGYCAYQNDFDNFKQAPQERNIDLFRLKNIVESDIIIEFKQPVQEPPKLQEAQPVPQMPAPRLLVRTRSVSIQILPVAPPRLPEPLKEPEPPVRVVEIPKLPKEVVEGPMGLKKSSVVLTDSIEITQRRDQKQKTRGSTFMEYYNSQTVKSPSNILEKYIKRKK